MASVNVPLTWRQRFLIQGPEKALLSAKKAESRATVALRALQMIKTDLEKLQLIFVGVPKLITHYQKFIEILKRKQDVTISPFFFGAAIETDREYHSFALDQEKECKNLLTEAGSIARLLPIVFPQEKMRHQNALTSIIKQCNRWFLKWRRIRTNPTQFRSRYVVDKRLSKEITGYVIGGSQGKGISTCIYDCGIINISHPLFRERVTIAPGGDRIGEGDVAHATMVAATAVQFAPSMSLYSVFGGGVEILANVRVVNMSMQLPPGYLSKNPEKSEIGLLTENRVLVVAIGNDSLDASRNEELAEECSIIVSEPRTLLVAALAVDGVTPAQYTNLPGDHFWKSTVYAPGRSEMALQLGSREIFEGTSIAAPIVSALAATILSTYPTLTEKEVVEAIKEGAEPIVPGIDGMPYALASQQELEHPKYNGIRAMSRRIWGMGRINFAKALAIAGNKVRASILYACMPDFTRLDWVEMQLVKEYTKMSLTQIIQQIPLLRTVTLPKNLSEHHRNEVRLALIHAKPRPIHLKEVIYS